MDETHNLKPKRKREPRRGYYSELTTNLNYVDLNELQGLGGAYKKSKLLWEVRTERHGPVVEEVTKPTRPSFLAPAERWMCYEEEKQIVIIVTF